MLQNFDQFIDKLFSTDGLNAEQIFDTLKTANIRLGYKNSRGQTLLHIAIENNKADVVEILLNKNNIDIEEEDRININEKDNKFDTAIDIAVKCNRQDFFEMLLRHKALDIKCLYRALKTAIKKNLADIVIKLLDFGTIDINEVDKKGNTLLHVAASTSNIEPQIVEQLLSRVADINATNNLEETPLHRLPPRMPSLESTTVLEIFLNDERINLNIQDSRGSTVVHQFLSYDLYPPIILNKALDKFSGVNLQDTEGRTVLHCLLSKRPKFRSENILPIINRLLEMGAAPDLIDNIDGLPVQCAIKFGYGNDIVQTLLNNLDLTKRYGQNKTLELWARENKLPKEMIELLTPETERPYNFYQDNDPIRYKSQKPELRHLLSKLVALFIDKIKEMDSKFPYDSKPGLISFTTNTSSGSRLFWQLALDECNTYHNGFSEVATSNLLNTLKELLKLGEHLEKQPDFASPSWLVVEKGRQVPLLHFLIYACVQIKSSSPEDKAEELFSVFIHKLCLAGNRRFYEALDFNGNTPFHLALWKNLFQISETLFYFTNDLDHNDNGGLATRQLLEAKQKVHQLSWSTDNIGQGLSPAIIAMQSDIMSYFRSFYGSSFKFCIEAGAITMVNLDTVYRINYHGAEFLLIPLTESLRKLGISMTYKISRDGRHGEKLENITFSKINKAPTISGFTNDDIETTLLALVEYDIVLPPFIREINSQLTIENKPRAGVLENLSQSIFRLFSLQPADPSVTTTTSSKPNPKK